ncbi:MAG: FIST signal transduction protein [Burkholderiales bacterium]
MSRFHLGHARGDDWQLAARACAAQLAGSGGTLGFVYVTDHVADHFDDVLQILKQSTGVADWTGTVGLGVLATGSEYLDEPAVVAMTGDFAPGAYRFFSGIDSVAALKNADLACADGAAHFAVVHADPANEDVVPLVTKLAERMESGFVVGGLTSSRRRNLQVAGRVLEGGLSGVAFSDQITVATRLTQGCSPIGPRRTITQAERNIIVTIDDRPALEVFREDIGERLSREVEKLGGTIFVGLPIKGSDTGDYLVRHLVGIDPSNKLIAIGDYVKPGAQLMFCRRDAEAAGEDLRRMLESIQQGLFAKPRGGVYYSCLGRGANLFGSNSEELRTIENALGDIPIAGFFCNGEISHNRLYGYTGVLTLFV